MKQGLIASYDLERKKWLMIVCRTHRATTVYCTLLWAGQDLENRSWMIGKYGCACVCVWVCTWFRTGTLKSYEGH